MTTIQWYLFSSSVLQFYESFAIPIPFWPWDLSYSIVSMVGILFFWPWHVKPTTSSWWSLLALYSSGIDEKGNWSFVDALLRAFLHRLLGMPNQDLFFLSTASVVVTEISYSIIGHLSFGINVYCKTHILNFPGSCLPSIFPKPSIFSSMKRLTFSLSSKLL